MKRNNIFGISLFIALLSPAILSAKSKSDTSMFPTPKVGMKQIIIDLPSKKNEDNLKVELFSGKEMAVDCNRHFMAGNITEETVNGWGYNYYVVQSEGHVASTRMGCPDNKLSNEFIHLQPLTVRYNSKLPIVIYAPEDLDVRYRIWKTSKKLRTTKTALTAATSQTNEIESKVWQLVELRSQPVKGNAETHYLKFNTKEGIAQAKAGCNIINLPYEIKNEYQIRFGDGLSTMMACPDNLEDELKEVLRMVDNLSYDGKETLTLNRARMIPLAVFKLVK